MGFDIHVSVTADDGRDEFDRSIVECAFKSLAVDQSGDSWNLPAPDGKLYYGAVFVDDQPRITNFMVSRPPVVPEVWNAMFEVLRRQDGGDGLNCSVVMRSSQTHGRDTS
jgi:hypothetical protein